MEHLYQNSGKYDNIPSSMEAEEKARWKRLFQDHLNDKGYAPKPVEVDAREKGRNFANQMSYKDFEELCNQVP